MELSKTVAANIKRIREKQDLSRVALVEKLNLRGIVRWTPSKLTNIEHGKGDARAISIDEIYDLCRALEVTEFQLTLPHDEPGWSRAFQTALYGFDYEGLDWIDTIQDRRELLSRLRWHPEVISHTMPFWLEADAFSDFRSQVEDEMEDRYRSNLVRDERDAQSDFIDDQRKIVSLKEKEWAANNLPMPTDAMVDKWIKSAYEAQHAARQRYQPSFVGNSTGRTGIEVVQDDEKGDS